MSPPYQIVPLMNGCVTMANAYHCLNYAMVTLTALTTVQMKENVIVSTCSVPLFVHKI